MLPILRVDLTNRKVDHFPAPKEWEQTYLGGASLAARILYATGPAKRHAEQGGHQ